MPKYKVIAEYYPFGKQANPLTNEMLTDALIEDWKINRPELFGTVIEEEKEKKTKPNK